MKSFLSTTMLWVSLFLGYHLTAQAQDAKMQVGPGFEVLVPIGDWSDAANLGVGITGQFQYNLNDNMGITGTLGYIHFLTDTEGFSFGMIPIVGGFKYYFGEGNGGFYAHPQFGITLLRTKVDLGGFGSVSNTSTELTLSAGAGYELSLGNMKLDIGARFQFIDDASSIGTRIGLIFPIGN